MPTIDEKLDRIDTNLDTMPEGNDEVINWALNELRSIYSKLETVRRDDAYQRFVMRYVSEFDPEENCDDDGEPLPPCSCANDCPIIRGQLPARIENSSNPEVDAEKWALAHNGTPHALIRADEAYRDLKAEIHHDLTRIKIGTGSHKIITPEELEESTPNQPTNTQTPAQADD